MAERNTLQPHRRHRFDYHLRSVATGSRQYVAKIAGDQQSPEFVALENAALRHVVGANLPFYLPQMQENKFVNFETLIGSLNSSSKRLRIIKFIQGKVWSKLTDISKDLLFDLGQKLAQFDLAMRGFEHSAAHRAHRWNLTRGGQHRDRIALVDDPGHPNWFVSVPPAWRLLEQLRNGSKAGS